MTKEVKEKILYAVQLATLINPTSTTQDVTGNKPTISIQYFGACAMLYVHIYPNGYSPDDGRSESYSYYDGVSDANELNDIIERLVQIYDEWGVRYE